ncbi:MAG: leucyl aminopeptidase [bacterium]
MELSTFGGPITAYAGTGTTAVLAVGRFADEGPSAAEKALDEALGGALSAACDRLLFKGRPRQRVGVDTIGRLPAARVVVIGLGDRAKLSPAGLRDFAAGAADEAFAGRHGEVGLVAPTDGLESLALGLLLGTYRWNALQTEDAEAPRHKVTRGTVLTQASGKGAFARATRLADAVCLARTLTNEPPNVCTPVRLADVAASIATARGTTLKVLTRSEIEAEGMGGIVAVSQGATREPRFIHLTYTPPSGRTDGAIALVGKGLTFDSGGLSLKPPKSQIEMYIDMAGSAAVLGAMQAIVALQPDIPVHGIVGACENMPGGNSYRPSDVLTMYSGKTVEVLNTDAEGRLVLADCIHYATKLKPSAIVNLATLTGACLVALGQYYGGLFSDDEGLAAEVADAAKAADERLWRLPLDPKLAETIKSARADIANLGGQWGGAITAAQFLQHFKGDCRWAHLDIAGPVLAEKDDGYIRKGGTGFGVLTLVALVEAAAAAAA